MRYLHDAATWVAALSVATGIACIIAFLYGTNPQSDALTTAEAAAAIGGISLLVSILVVNFPTQRRAGPGDSLDERQAGYGEVSWYKRRELLVERLNIDEPRLCSQYIIPCTCWSFCAESNVIGSAGNGESPAVQKNSLPASPLSAAHCLRVVHRDGMDSCQFRFASPLARPVPNDGAMPCSSASRRRAIM